MTRKFWGFSLAMVLTACGGGGDSSTPVADKPPESGQGQGEGHENNNPVTQLAGFDCEPIAGGTYCEVSNVQSKTPAFSYVPGIAVLIPQGVSAPANIWLHFQGDRGVCGDQLSTPADQETALFELEKHLAHAQATNSVIVFPTSRSRPDYDNSLVPQFKNFILWVEQKLGGNAKWTVSAHSSGGYRAAKALSSQTSFVKNKLSSVLLLDAAFSMSSALPLWKTVAQNNPQTRFWNVSTGATTAGAASLVSGLKPLLKTPVQSTTVTAQMCKAISGDCHCKIPNVYYGPFVKAAVP